MIVVLLAGTGAVGVGFGVLTRATGFLCTGLVAGSTGCVIAGSTGFTTSCGICSGATSFCEPIECGTRPVSEATPTAEKTVTEMAAAVSSG